MSAVPVTDGQACVYLPQLILVLIQVDVGRITSICLNAEPVHSERIVATEKNKCIIVV